MAEPAGFTFIEDKSPPSAPKAPPIALKRAVPFKLSCAYRTASGISCDRATLEVKPINIRYKSFFIFFSIKFIFYLLRKQIIFFRLRHLRHCIRHQMIFHRRYFRHLRCSCCSMMIWYCYCCCNWLS